MRTCQGDLYFFKYFFFATGKFYGSAKCIEQHVVGNKELNLVMLWAIILTLIFKAMLQWPWPLLHQKGSSASQDQPVYKVCSPCVLSSGNQEDRHINRQNIDLLCSSLQSKAKCCGWNSFLAFTNVRVLLNCYLKVSSKGPT